MLKDIKGNPLEIEIFRNVSFLKNGMVRLDASVLIIEPVQETLPGSFAGQVRGFMDTSFRNSFAIHYRGGESVEMAVESDGRKGELTVAGEKYMVFADHRGDGKLIYETLKLNANYGELWEYLKQYATDPIRGEILRLS